MKIWIVALLGALAFSVLAVLLRLLQLETTAQLLWFLGIIAFLWCAVQISLLLRPGDRNRRTTVSEGSTSESRGRPRGLLERFFPGASLSSGTYNKRNRKAWDENENLPNYHND